MGKLAMLLVLAGAFCYAVWLVAWRRLPEAPSGMAGWRRHFIILTLFFMHCLGAQAVTAELHDGVAFAGDYTAATDDGIAFYDAFVSAWTALGHMKDGDMLARVGEPAVRDAYRRALAEKDRDTLSQLRREHYDETRKNYKKQFPDLMMEAAKSGRISPNAADLLVMLYSRLDSHYLRMQATCYRAVPLRREIQTKDTLFDIERKIGTLVGGAPANRKARYELMLDLERMQTHLIEKRNAL